MDSHTPGPWIVRPRTDTRDAVRIVVMRGHLEREVCEVATPDGEQEGWSNSYLIAAAPLLIEACREAVAYLGQIAEHPRLEQQLRDAIDKAEGRES